MIIDNCANVVASMMLALEYFQILLADPVGRMSPGATERGTIIVEGLTDLVTWPQVDRMHVCRDYSRIAR